MNALVEHVPQPTQVMSTEQQALMAMIEKAVFSPDFDPDKLQKMLDLKDRWDAAAAKKAFNAAMAEFKLSAPTIYKNKHVSFQTSKGTTEYHHATLGGACEAIIEKLAQVGISHSWELEQGDKQIRVTCVLTHTAGHVEKRSLAAFADDSGGKNAIQAISSTVTYLERYTLLAATGLASEDLQPDNDGAGASEPTITERELADLNALISEVGANKANFLKFCKIDRLEQLKAKNYKHACQALREKGKS